jgi:LPXTG-motif cell wall-anchored protein
MDNVTMIRVIAGALAVVVLFIIIYRRKRKSVE